MVVATSVSARGKSGTAQAMLAGPVGRRFVIRDQRIDDVACDRVVTHDTNRDLEAQQEIRG
jgi:hypothetical protein